MTNLLVLFLLVLIAPLVLSTWRFSLVGLALQGFLMTWMVFAEARPITPSGLVQLADLFVVRGCLVPWMLYRVVRRPSGSRRGDVLPGNLQSWSFAGALVLLAFRFGDLVAPGNAELATHISVAAAGVALGFAVLATQESVFEQVIGVLRIENAIALFELASGHEHPVEIQVGVALVFVLTAVTLAGFLRRLIAAPASTTPTSPSSAEETTL